jgi:Flp pilus assembly protein TadD
MTRSIFLGALLVAALSLVLPSGESYAAGSSDGGSSASSTKSAAKVRNKDPNYAAAMKAVKSESWSQAVALLRKVVATDGTDADAQNWLGFSYRKAGDFDSAFKHYALALDLNPNHQGAHEYLGEAYLETDDLKMAQNHLKKLGKICAYDCDAYRGLSKAVKAYKKTHNTGY